MPTIEDVMTRDVQRVSPEDSVHRAAQIMKEFNIGSVPVVDGEKLVGMITDRDITVRSTAAGKAPQTSRVGDAMSTAVRTCHASQSVDEVLTQMGDVQIRRVPVVDQQSHALIGIVSLGDMATKQTSGIGQALQEISSPTDAGAKAG
jgi:CBS domain-containing protein